MTDILQEIIAHKKQENRQLGRCPMQRHKKIIDPLATLRQQPVIAEIKRRSPAAGALNPTVNVEDQARQYQRYGAGAISVLTDQHYFNGSFATLATVASCSNLPLLCKDFIIAENQIDWAYHAGADLILLLVAALEQSNLLRLYRYARKLGLQVLVEIHEQMELRQALELQPDLLGVNSRDLSKMVINPAQAVALLQQLPRTIPIRVAESGIGAAEDVRQYHQAGANAFLVGSALMTSSDLASSFANLYLGLQEHDPG